MAKRRKLRMDLVLTPEVHDAVALLHNTGLYGDSQEDTVLQLLLPALRRSLREEGLQMSQWKVLNS